MGYQGQSSLVRRVIGPKVMEQSFKRPDGSQGAGRAEQLNGYNPALAARSSALPFRQNPPTWHTGDSVHASRVKTKYNISS